MFKNTFSVLCFFTIVNAGLASGQDTGPNMGIIPAPVSLKKSTGEFTLSGQTTIFADSVTNKAVAFLADYLQNKAMLHIQLKTNTGGPADNSLVLTAAGTENLPAEGYRLII